MQVRSTELVHPPPTVLLLYCDYPEVDDPNSHGKKVLDWNGSNCIINMVINYHGWQYQHVGSIMHHPGHFTGMARYLDRVWGPNPNGNVVSALKIYLEEGVQWMTPEPPEHPKLHCYILKWS